MAATRPIDPAKLEAFLGKVVTDLGAGLSCALALLGDRLGLYKAMAGAGPLTSAQVAERTGLSERYVREWLLNQAAGGYVEYRAELGAYELPPEQAAALADDESPFHVAGGFEVLAALSRAEPRIEESFRTGSGMTWSEHDPCLFSGTGRFFRAGYRRDLVSSWLPSLEGVVPRLQEGARVADVGCGLGHSTTIMASAFPRSRFHGFDDHEPSIDTARREATAAGLGDRTSFEVAKASQFPDHGGYDLVAFFDCVHDMGDPVSALARARQTLAPGGVVMMVEPMAGDRVEENLNPVGRVFSGASALCCTPNAVATGGRALGTCAPDSDLAQVAREAGLPRFRRATSTPFNRVFEARA
jgi:2-polyprenyl-3-methyl-5-hydroxy-6-metoxy-1,4-benzoquinol methylase